MLLSYFSSHPILCCTAFWLLCSCFLISWGISQGGVSLEDALLFQLLLTLGITLLLTFADLCMHVTADLWPLWTLGSILIRDDLGLCLAFYCINPGPKSSEYFWGREFCHVCLYGTWFRDDVKLTIFWNIQLFIFNCNNCVHINNILYVYFCASQMCLYSG